MLLLYQSIQDLATLPKPKQVRAVETLRQDLPQVLHLRTKTDLKEASNSSLGVLKMQPGGADVARIIFIVTLECGPNQVFMNLNARRHHGSEELGVTNFLSHAITSTTFSNVSTDKRCKNTNTYGQLDKPPASCFSRGRKSSLWPP